MATRTIGLSEDAYDRLASLKKEGESFSDVVRRLTGAHALMRLAGTMPPDVAEHYRKAAREHRKRADKDRVARVRRMLR